VLHIICPDESRAHVVLLRWSMLERHTPMAAAGFVCQPLQALLRKPLHPFVNKATADPDRGGNVGDWYPIGYE
jgi:hypothetical protein